MYDGLGLFQCFWFPRRELLEVIDEFNDDFRYLASTKGSSSALVGGWSCTCLFHCTFQSLVRVCVCVHFIVYSVETVTEAGPVRVKYRQPYASTVVTDSILCILAAIWWGCRKFESST